jgi:hypothetical protein
MSLSLLGLSRAEAGKSLWFAQMRFLLPALEGGDKTEINSFFDLLKNWRSLVSEPPR